MWLPPAADGKSLCVDNARLLKKDRQAQAQVMKRIIRTLDEEENDQPVKNKKRKV